MPILASLPFHRQNTGEFCGPACAQMVLRGLGVPHDRLHQHLLFQESSASPTGDPGSWYSYPDGLTKVLNVVWKAHLAGLGLDPGTRFALFVCDTHDRLTEVLRRTIEHPRTKAAPIVLGMNSEHWVVARGYDPLPGFPPPSPFPSQFRPGPVSGWYLHNPFPVVSGATEVTSHADEDMCLLLAEDQRWPCSHMNAAYWEQKYVTPTVRGSRWDGKLLAICQVADPTIPDFHEIPRAGGAPTSFSPPSPPSQGQGPGVPLPPRTIRAIANELLATTTFDHGSCVTNAMRGTTAGTPMLVNGDPDDPGEAYYLVPYLRDDPVGRGRTEVAAVAIFDAETGAYQEAGANPRGTALDPAMINPAELRRRHETADVVLARVARPAGAFPLRLVWQASDESRSRFMPFLVAEPRDQPPSLDVAPAATPEAALPAGQGFQRPDDDVAAAARIEAPPAFIRLDGQAVPALTDAKP